MISSESGISNWNFMLDTLIDAASPKAEDSLMKMNFKEFLKKDFPAHMPGSTTLHVEIKNDSIWRYNTKNGEMIGDYVMIEKNSGILNYYNKTKSVNYRKFDLFENGHEYEILENKKDRKEIRGYDCFKVTLIKKDAESDLGNTIYEMYVTDQMDLPVHSVINLTTLVPNTFPMEINISEENLPGLAEQYELIEIQ